MSRDFYRNRCKLGSIAQIDTVVPEYFTTYTFNTSQAPEASFWDSQITSVTSNGSEWVFASGGSGYKTLKTTNRFVANNGIEAYLDFSFPSTSQGYNGFSLRDTTETNGCNVWYSYNYGQGYLHTEIRINGSATKVRDVIIGSLTRTNSKIKINTDGSAEIYLNGTLHQSAPAGTFSGKTLVLAIQKYIETTGYVYSGYIKYK